MRDLGERREACIEREPGQKGVSVRVVDDRRRCWRAPVHAAGESKRLGAPGFGREVASGHCARDGVLALAVHAHRVVDEHPLARLVRHARDADGVEPRGSAQ